MTHKGEPVTGKGDHRYVVIDPNNSLKDPNANLTVRNHEEESGWITYGSWGLDARTPEAAATQVAQSTSFWTSIYFGTSGRCWICKPPPGIHEGAVLYVVQIDD